MSGLDRVVTSEVEGGGELVFLALRLNQLDAEIRTAEENLKTLVEDRNRATKAYEARLEIIKRPHGGADPGIRFKEDSNAA